MLDGIKSLIDEKLEEAQESITNSVFALFKSQYSQYLMSKIAKFPNFYRIQEENELLKVDIKNQTQRIIDLEHRVKLQKNELHRSREEFRNKIEEWRAFKELLNRNKENISELVWSQDSNNYQTQQSIIVDEMKILPLEDKAAENLFKPSDNIDGIELLADLIAEPEVNFRRQTFPFSRMDQKEYIVSNLTNMIHLM